MNAETRETIEGGSEDGFEDFDLLGLDDEDDPLVGLGRELRALCDLDPATTVAAVLGRGGALVLGGMVGAESEPPDPYLLNGFGAVAWLARSRQPDLMLVDDGEASPETLAAAAWSLMSLDPRRLVLVAPVASRYLEAALPPLCEVVALRRYVPVRADPPRSRSTLAAPGSVASPASPPARRRPRPERAGRPWTAEEEQQLDALIRERKPLQAIAETLGRTRGAVSSRIAQLAVRRGSVTPEGLDGADASAG